MDDMVMGYLPIKKKRRRKKETGILTRLVARPELLPDHGVTCSPVLKAKYLQMLSSVFPHKHKSMAKAGHRAYNQHQLQNKMHKHGEKSSL